MTSFEFMCRMYGVDLAYVDSFISRLEVEGAGAAEELRERRQKALDAYKTKKLDAFKRHMEWIILRIQLIEVADRVQPEVNLALRVRKGPQLRGNVADRNEARDYARAHWKKYPNEPLAVVADLPTITRIGPYIARTRQNWIRDLKPGGTHRGRPRKK